MHPVISQCGKSGGELTTDDTDNTDFRDHGFDCNGGEDKSLPAEHRSSEAGSAGEARRLKGQIVWVDPQPGGWLCQGIHRREISVFPDCRRSRPLVSLFAKRAIRSGAIILGDIIASAPREEPSGGCLTLRRGRRTGRRVNLLVIYWLVHAQEKMNDLLK